jgi:membrane-associated phospholipid phosphatase
MAHSVDDELQGDVAGEASAVGETGDFLGDRFFVMGNVAGLFAAGQIAPEGRFRSVTFDVAQGLILNGVLTSALKLAVGRERPDGRNSRSFPSGHTSTSFMYATVLGRHLGSKVGIPAAMLATFIGVSRLEHDAHFLSDVVAGATLGFIVGRTVTAHLGRDAAERVVSLSPMAVPGGGGVVVALRW